MAAIKKLSATKVNKLNQPGRYGDGGGLWLQVSQFGSKAWIFRFMLNGRARQMGLGPLKTISLAEAREKARAARQLLLEGIDPIEHRERARAAARLEDSKQVTFAEAAKRYIDAHRSGWRNAKHAGQWRSTLETYAYPVAGDLPVAAIDISHITRILEPIWETKTETAARLRARIENILDWAEVRGYRQGDNPARWKGYLSKLLPARSKVAPVQHHKAMPYQEVPSFMAELRVQDSVSARALEFTVLTAARTGEAIGARWSEVDLEGQTWLVPADRMKASREHRVPLSDRAVDVLQSLPRLDGAEFVFPGARPHRPLSNMAMLELLRGTKGKGLTVHGFRSSFRDWAAERTAYPREVAEAALGHVVGDKVEAAYRRGDLFEKRQQLMSDWASFCTMPAGTGDVVPLRKTLA